MKRTLIAWFLICCTSHCFCQKNEFLIRNIPLSNDFNDQIINHIERDSAGLLWVATNSALYRYDGNEAIRFDKNSRPAVAHGSITDILADCNDNLWISGLDGLTRFDLKTWETFRIKPDTSNHSGITEANIQSIGQGTDGRIYAGTRDGKLYQVVDDQLELVMQIEKRFRDIYRVAAIYQISSPYPGELWLSTEIGKMIRIKVDGSRYSQPEYFGTEEIAGAAITQTYFHSSGKCLLNVPQRGLFVFDTHEGPMERVILAAATELGKNGIVYFAPSNADELLIFTNQGIIGKETLFIYNFPTDTVRVQKVQYPEYLKSNHIDWFHNTGAALLLSLNNHVVQLVPAKQLFTTMLSDAVAINSIRSIYKGLGGQLFVGSYKDRFISIDEATGEQTAEATQFVYDILPWNADTLLLTTEGDGLFWYETNKQRLTPLTPRAHQTGDHAAQRYMTTLTRADRESVWVGTYTGLLWVNPYTLTFRPIRDDVLAQTKILSVVERGDKLWIGTATGLVEWDGQTDSLTYLTRGDQVYCITPVGDAYWIGTDGKGILILDDDGRVTDRITNSKGLSNNIVYSILTDGNQVVAATQNGLSVIDRETGRIRNYSRLDQLPASEFNYSAAFNVGDTAYLGTINGLVRFSMAEVNTSHRMTLPEHVPLHVTRLAIEHNGTTQHHYSFPYQQSGGIAIDAGTRYFSIGFGGWSEFARELHYYYRLGDQSDWYPLGNRQEIAFVEMPPGNYQLQLTARMPDGRPTHSVMEVPLIVRPAFYQTMWFKALLLLTVVLAIWSIFRYRENLSRKEKKMRIKIASDLHDEVGSSLTRIYFQADMLSTKRASVSDDKQLRHIADTSKQALLTMSDMVWSIDSRFDTVKDLVIRMKDYLYKLREELEISYRFDVRGEQASRAVSQIVRQNLFLIFKEALTNAIKYGDGSEITIELNLERLIQLTVTNRYVDGNGHITDQQGGHGLESMQQRTARMNGELVCTAEDGVFRLTLLIR